MMLRFFIVLLLVLIFMFNGCQSNDPTPTSNVLKDDIQRAFNLITNDTKRLESIMYEMYRTTMMQQTEAMMIFQLPNNDGRQKSSSSTEKMAATNTIWISRNELMTPIFPNITHNDMIERFKRISTMKMNRATTTNQQWQLLGLPGWSGEVVASASQLNVQQKKTPSGEVAATTSNKYPIKEILRDLYATKIETTDEEAISISSNIYIARVNDPFGYSTKWQMRNTTTTALSSTPADTTGRPKRDIVELYSMIRCATGCDPLGYKGYGCYCGFSGGGIPVDSIDVCCRIHDKCYERAANCISYLEYFVPYVWKCYFGKPLCALDHGEWGGPLSCAARLCQCDVQLSLCLRQYICPWQRETCSTRFARFLGLINSL